MADNLIDLDLSRFTRADREKIRRVGVKLKLMRRWFRCEIVPGENGEEARLYSGDRGPKRYAHYRIVRDRGGGYALVGANSDDPIREARAIDPVIEAIPDDFFYR